MILLVVRDKSRYNAWMHENADRALLDSRYVESVTDLEGYWPTKLTIIFQSGWDDRPYNIIRPIVNKAKELRAQGATVIRISGSFL